MYDANNSFWSYLSEGIYRRCKKTIRSGRNEVGNLKK